MKVTATAVTMATNTIRAIDLTDIFPLVELSMVFSSTFTEDNNARAL
jgi:hypothetical protein